MRKLFIYVVSVMSVWLVLAQCVLLKNRMRDDTVSAVFMKHKQSVRIYDTLIRNRNIHYAISGSDTMPTLVFIHGSPGSWSNYRKFMWDSVLLKRFRMASVDRPGFGFSNFGYAMHLKDQSTLVLDVIRKIDNGKPVYVCGHSMGAPVAVSIAAMDPQLIDQLILVGAPLDVALEPKETWRTVMGVKPLYWMLPGAYGPSNTELLYLKKDLSGFENECAKLTADVYFIHGDEDTWVPIENIAFGIRHMKQARTVRADTLQGAGHMIPWKNKTEFRDLLRALP